MFLKKSYSTELVDVTLEKQSENLEKLASATRELSLLEHTFKIRMVLADQLFSDKRKFKRLNMISMMQCG